MQYGFEGFIYKQLSFLLEVKAEDEGIFTL